MAKSDTRGVAVSARTGVVVGEAGGLLVSASGGMALLVTPPASTEASASGEFEALACATVITPATWDGPGDQTLRASGRWDDATRRRARARPVTWLVVVRSMVTTPSRRSSSLWNRCASRSWLAAPGAAMLSPPRRAAVRIERGWKRYRSR